MKHIIISLILTLCILPTFAQAVCDSTKTGNNIILKEVSKKLDIKDKIIICNRSPYVILQAVVAVVDEKGGYNPLGKVNNVSPIESAELASFDDDKLEDLKQKIIAIKVKGTKISIDGEVSSFVTYCFDVNLYESHHDLYIDVFNTDGYTGNVMDF